VGGLHTDWDAVPDWAHSGYPIVECRRDGGFAITKPPGTGGLVTPATVAEQLLYEIGDPARYVLPDVVCDFTAVTLEQAGPERVEVKGARGTAPTPTYKVSATYADGFRSNAQLTIVGVDAEGKARRTAEAILERTRELFRAQSLSDYGATQVQVLGAADAFGGQVESGPLYEAVMWLAVTHPSKAALEIFAREIAPAATSWAPGTTGASGRPSVTPSIKQFAFLLEKSAVQPNIDVDGNRVGLGPPPVSPRALGPGPPSPGRQAATGQEQWAETQSTMESVEVPLIKLAYARSGDKGDTSNIGVIARKPEWLPLLRARLTEAAVVEYLAHLVKGKVTRYELPGIHALNFVCEQALAGGGMASLRNDALGKGMAQVLLAMPIRVPHSLWQAVVGA
jgi:hypothetical protein